MGKLLVWPKRGKETKMEVLETSMRDTVFFIFNLKQLINKPVFDFDKKHVLVKGGIYRKSAALKLLKIAENELKHIKREVRKEKLKSLSYEKDK